MNAPTTLPPLHFHCSHCGAGLSVPAELAGIEGPCPGCGAALKAPTASVPTPPSYHTPLPWVPAGRAAVAPGGRAAGGFKAKLAIPAPEEPPDESWRDRHRRRAKRRHRTDVAGEKALSVLESRAFKVGRVVMLLVTAGLTVFLFLYLQERDFRFTTEGPAGGTEPTDGGLQAGAGEASRLPPPDDAVPPGPKPGGGNTSPLKARGAVAGGTP